MIKFHHRFQMLVYLTTGKHFKLVTITYFMQLSVTLSQVLHSHMRLFLPGYLSPSIPGLYFGLCI